MFSPIFVPLILKKIYDLKKPRYHHFSDGTNEGALLQLKTIIQEILKIQNISEHITQNVLLNCGIAQALKSQI